LVLALILAATSLTLAAARGEMAGAGGVVLCSAGGPLTVDGSDDGAPSRLCPDCILTLLADAPPPSWLPRVLRQLPLAQPPKVPQAEVLRPLHPGAPRGPPALV